MLTRAFFDEAEEGGRELVLLLASGALRLWPFGSVGLLFSLSPEEEVAPAGATAVAAAGTLAGGIFVGER